LIILERENTILSQELQEFRSFLEKLKFYKDSKASFINYTGNNLFNRIFDNVKLSFSFNIVNQAWILNMFQQKEKLNIDQISSQDLLFSKK